MSTSVKYFDPETLARLRSLSLRGRHIVDGYISGMHRSPTRGQSIEFAEHREYSPGDDVRQIDWKVFARSDRYFVKQFENETNLIGVIALDCSESMTFRSPSAALSKLEYGQLVALTLALSLLDRRDAASLATFSEKLDRITEPSNQISRWEEMVQLMESAPVGSSTNTGAVLSELAARLQRRALVIVISDFLDQIDPLERGCQHLRSQQHDLLFLQVLDSAELDFPFHSPTTFQGMEGAGNVMIDPILIRQRYLEKISKHQQTLQGMCRQSSIDLGLLLTRQSLSDALPWIIARRNQWPASHR